MSKELPFFKFNPAEWLTGDITLEEYDVQGVFANVMAHYWQQKCSITLAWLNRRLTNASKHINRLIECGILKHDPQTDDVDVNFQKIQWNELGQRHETYVNNGRKGGKASVKHRLSNPQATLKQPSSIKKEKEKEIKIKKEIKNIFIPPTESQVIEYFKENGYSELGAKKAYNHYHIADWHDTHGKPVKSWKQKMSTNWFKEEFKMRQEIATSPSALPRHLTHNTNVRNDI